MMIMEADELLILRQTQFFFFSPVLFYSTWRELAGSSVGLSSVAD